MIKHTVRNMIGVVVSDVVDHMDATMWRLGLIDQLSYDHDMFWDLLHSYWLVKMVMTIDNKSNPGLVDILEKIDGNK